MLRLNATTADATSAIWNPTGDSILQAKFPPGSNAVVEVEVRLSDAAPWANFGSLSPFGKLLQRVPCLYQLRLSLHGSAEGQSVSVWDNSDLGLVSSHLFFSSWVEDVVLAASTVERIAIPAGKNFAIFSFDCDFRSKLGVLATSVAIPSVKTTDGSGSALNPNSRRIPPLLPDGSTVPTHICLISAAGGTGSIAFETL